MTILTTERLTLRHLTMSDAEALHYIHHEVGVWTCLQGLPPASVDDERAKIEEQLARYHEHGFGGWATVWSETGELIGRCGLRAQVIEGQAEMELGYALSPRFWGRELASEAARGIRDYAFASLDGAPRGPNPFRQCRLEACRHRRRSALRASDVVQRNRSRTFRRGKE